MQDNSIRLNVADLVVSLRTGPGVQVVGHVNSFLAGGLPEAAIDIRFGNESDWAGEWHELSIGEGLGWNAFRAADGKFILVERLGGEMLVRFGSDPRCRTVDVLLRLPGESSAGDIPPELELLLVETMPLPVVALLSGRGGLFVHSCAVALDGEGILFAGVSGSGKSTMAELWRRYGPRSSTVIDDEHILARSTAGSTMLFGAPWSRGARKATFSRTPAKAIFFLAHGEQNQCDRLSPGEALAQLMSQVFLPLWCQDHLELTVQTCARLLESIDCFSLQFVPGAEVVDFVQDVLGVSQ